MESRLRRGDSGDETQVIQETRARGLRTGDCEEETRERRFRLLMSLRDRRLGRRDPGQDTLLTRDSTLRKGHLGYSADETQ